MKKLLLAIALFSLSATSLKAQEITMFQGSFGFEFYQDKDKLTYKEINKIMSESTVAQMQWQKSKKQLISGMIVGAANFGSAIWFLVEDRDGNSVVAPAITFLGTGLISSILYKSAMKNKKKAILEYNDALGTKTSFRLVPTSNQYGVGLALKF
ncbi:hypothetical protein N9954_05235 [Maribacter sp.]|nr:hypothetical protein [Maribacter sp.]